MENDQTVKSVKEVVVNIDFNKEEDCETYHNLVMIFMTMIGAGVDELKISPKLDGLLLSNAYQLIKKDGLDEITLKVIPREKEENVVE